MRELFAGRLKWQCVEEPYEWGEHLGPTDSKTDGPWKQQEAACLAQQRLYLGDYVELDPACARPGATCAICPTAAPVSRP